MTTAQASPVRLATPERVEAGIWRLPLPMKAPPGHINSWLLEDGDHWLVVDTGTRAADTRAHWRAFMASPLYRGGIRRIFLTHAHPDHLGSAAWLARETGAPVLMADAERQAMHDLALPAAQRDEEIAQWLPRWQASDKQIAHCQLFYQHFATGCPLIGSDIQTAAPGDTLTVNGDAWQVHGGYGHTPCNLLLYSAARKVLITGDQVLPDIVTNVSTWWRQAANPLQAYLDTLEALVPLEVKQALPAHGDPFDSFARRLVTLRDEHARRLEQLMQAIGPRGRTSAELVRDLGGKTVTSPLYLLVAGQIYARLACLQGQGRITFDDATDVWCIA